MISDDELRSELNGLADQVDVSTVSLEQVQARGRRRTRYQRGAVVLAAFALVVGGTVAVTSLAGGDGPRDLATEDSATDGAASATSGSTADGEAGESADATGDTNGADALGTATTTTVAPGDVVTDASFDTISAYEGEGPPQVVAWGDGFLAIGSRWVDADPEAALLASEFGSSEIAGYFPAEIIDVIEGAGDVGFDSDEVEAALDDAGLLDQATEIVAANPELLEWFVDVSPGGRSEAFAEYSDDGVTWEPVPGFSWPGNGWAPQYTSNGRQLVAVSFGGPGFADGSGPGVASQEISVFTTDDLVTWTEARLPLDRPDLPSFVSGDFSPGQIALGDDGWYLTIGFWGWVDLWEALPADVRAEVDEYGYGWNPTPDGVEIQDWAAAESLPVPTTTVPGGDGDAVILEGPFGDDWAPTVVEIVPWSEMPFDYDEYQAFAGAQSSSLQAFVGDFAGNVSPATTPVDAADGNQVVATDAGLFMLVFDYGAAEPGFDDSAFGDGAGGPALRSFTSADGRRWTEVALALPDDVWVDSMTSVDDGILLATSGGDPGQRFYLGAPNGTGFVPVEGPDVGNAWVWFPAEATGAGVAAVVDLGEASAPEFVAWTAAFTHDGYDIELDVDDQGMQELTVRRDGEVVIERTLRVFEGQPYEWIDDGIRLSDVDGTIVIDIPLDIVDAEIFGAESAAWEAVWEADPYVADFRVIASRDGRTWTVSEVPSSSGAGWFGTPAINGDMVVVFDGRGTPVAIELP